MKYKNSNLTLRFIHASLEHSFNILKHFEFILFKSFYIINLTLAIVTFKLLNINIFYIKNKFTHKNITIKVAGDSPLLFLIFKPMIDDRVCWTIWVILKIMSKILVVHSWFQIIIQCLIFQFYNKNSFFLYILQA